MTNVLEVNNVSKKIGNFSLENISFTLERGQIIGIIGKNGAGKTTLLKLILEILTKDNGSIKTIPKQDIGVVIGEHVYYENLSCIEMAKILSHFYKKWNWDDFKKYMQAFSLPLKQKIEELSKGMKVKFSLACALSHQAQLLILDEPTSGLDPSARYKLLEELHSMANLHNMSILFTSHISSDIEQIANKIIYLKSGKLVDFIDIAMIGKKYTSIKTNDFNVVQDLKQNNIFLFKHGDNWETVVNSSQIDNLSKYKNLSLSKATLDDIICFMAEDEE